LKVNIQVNQSQKTDRRDPYKPATENIIQAKGVTVAGEYKGAFLTFDITPNVSQDNLSYLQGMAGGLRVSTAVAIPLSMEICMLEDAHFTKLLFVTADILGFDKVVVEEVRRHAAPWGIEPEGIVLNASHTHYAPGTLAGMAECMGPFYENYTRQILEIIVASLQNLYNRLEPCAIYAGKSDAKIGLNRRVISENKVLFAPNPDGAYISNTPLLQLSFHSSKRTVLWVSHGCHPTGMGADTRISSDYAGYMKHTLTEKGATDGVMFFQGAGGSSKEATEINGKWKFSNSVAEVRQNGQNLAVVVKAALDKGLHPVSGRFFCARQHIDLPTKPSPDGSSHPLPLEVQMLFLGDRLNMLCFPMEPAAELAEKIAGLDGFSSSDFLLGYTNGLNGYLVTDKMIAEGGYETEQSHLVYQQPAALAMGTESLVVDSVKQLLSVKGQTDAAHGDGQRPVTSGPKQAFFVLSTGRCGTMTLAHLLNTATNARVWHHPQPDPIKEALLAWWEKIDLQSVFWKVRGSIIHQSWSQGLIHGETDLLMTPFSEAIAQELPEAKFIVLTRDPRGFVRSGMRRQYYRKHPWDFGRLRPEENTPDFERWKRLDHFEKVCWLWNATHVKILDISKRLGPERVRFLRMEDMIEGPAAMAPLFKFLDLEGFDADKIDAILAKKLNAQQNGNFPPPQEWRPAQHDTLWRICGSMADQLGYPRSCPPGRIEKMEKPSHPVPQGHPRVGDQPQTRHGSAGRNGQIAKDSVITCPFSIGNYSNIMGKAIIKGNRACRIGKYCALGWGIHIITSHHDISRVNIQIGLQQRHGFRNIWVSNGDVQIGHNVWIGDNAVILSGVNVGDGAVIGAGAIVMDDLPPFSVAAGNPAHVIKMRFCQNIIDQLLEIKWWNWTEERISRNRTFFDLDLTADPDLDLSRIIVP
jgi:virginiamycin A acetyltransferase